MTLPQDLDQLDAIITRLQDELIGLDKTCRRLVLETDTTLHQLSALVVYKHSVLEHLEKSSRRVNEWVNQARAIHKNLRAKACIQPKQSWWERARLV